MKKVSEFSLYELNSMKDHIKQMMNFYRDCNDIATYFIYNNLFYGIEDCIRNKLIRQEIADIEDLAKVMEQRMKRGRL